MSKRFFFDGSTVRKIRRGGVGVIPTDTLYGIVGSALSKSAVARIYRLRKRNTKKPMIVLIGSLAQLGQFGMVPNALLKKLLNYLWPGKVSIVLSIRDSRFAARFNYLHRGTRSIAFRLPRPVPLRQFLLRTGPLVAPSANIAGQPPARTIDEAKQYFGARVDFYADAGKRGSLPSTVVVLRGKKVVVLRKGAR